jgi:acetyl/propionyl-CoA carboxylase alpha subunit
MRKLLIANRGEIAVRVMRSAREMGIRTVAVYSEADARMPHALLADEAVNLGAPEPGASYLDIEKVVRAAQDTGADAVHPGYGFLSERPEFVEACEAAGLTFVGPSAASMRALGSKTSAKEIAVREGVPVVPGHFAQEATREELKEAADRIGYPVMLKASAGGGGRGMRVVAAPEAFDAEFSTASDEALKGFGDGAMMVEKLIERPRHVEVQILADGRGGVAPLFERECSIQRRHQKLIEEAPSPLMARFPNLWSGMRDAAVALARAVEYRGAGTVEFLVDEASGEFYFIEVNARLQVEHPVTELVTGLDLVAWQLRVARGERVPEALQEGDRAALRGHAIEARLVAEDPAKGFLPSVGKIAGWAEPRMPGVRVDTGYGPGTEVSRYYDSLIAKVIAHGATREEAIGRLVAALEDFHVLGVATNAGYLIDVLRHPKFAQGDFDTGFLGREFPEWQRPEPPAELGAVAMAATSPGTSSTESGSPAGAWGEADGFRNFRF